MQVFTSSGTYTKSSGVNQIMVRLVAAGGGGSGHCESGGARILGEDYQCYRSYSISVVIGTGGTGTYYSGRSGQGSSSSFGTFMSATGGDGANQPINTQEDLEVLELVEMLICTVVVDPHTEE